MFTNDVNACNTSVSNEWFHTKKKLCNNPRCTHSTPDTNFNIEHFVDQQRISRRTVPVIPALRVNLRSSLKKMSVGSSSLSSNPWRYQCTNFSLALRSVSPRLWTVTVYPQWMQVQFCCNSRWWQIHLFAVWVKPDMFFYTSPMGHAVAQLVEALRYQPEGRGFDSRRILSLT